MNIFILPPMAAVLIGFVISSGKPETDPSQGQGLGQMTPYTPDNHMEYHLSPGDFASSKSHVADL
ncbi:MAG: hypothetical protein J6Y32_08620 [Bacteroidales bacterium]|nr:hypothetical protein [Bacteroidales bacterium]